MITIQHLLRKKKALLQCSINELMENLNYEHKMHLRVSPPEDLAGMKHAILMISFKLSKSYFQIAIYLTLSN